MGNDDKTQNEVSYGLKGANLFLLVKIRTWFNINCDLACENRPSEHKKLPILFVFALS